MRRLQTLLLSALMVLLATGCGGSNFIKAKGRVVKGGEPYHTPEGEGLRIFFAPEQTSDAEHYDSYAAAYDPDDGTFEVIGKDGRGLPPGQYRVGIQLMQKKEDLLGGRLLGKQSPFVVEVALRGNDIVLDLDQAHFDTLLAQAAKPAKGRGR
jgi:hypothetical protein